MKILEHMAQDIADKTTAILGYPISITDKEGYIIGSTDRSRLGNFHKPSLDVIRRNGAVDCESGLEHAPENVLPGISVPLALHNKPIGVLGIIGDPNEVIKYVHLVKSHVEMLCLEAFRKETMHLETKMVEIFVQQLIHFKNDEDAEPIMQYAKTLDYNLETDRVCLLIDIAGYPHAPDSAAPAPPPADPIPLPYLQQEILDYLNLLFKKSKDDIVSQISVERFIAILPVKSKTEPAQLSVALEKELRKLSLFLQSKYNRTAAISIGTVNRGLQGVSESYRSAAKTMSAGKRTKKENKIYACDDRLITLELLPQELSPDIRTKLQSIIAPLVKLGSYETLAATFLAYCKLNMNRSEVARTLFVHRNTVIYRLDKIAELTSLRLDCFEHCMLLYMAIRNNERTADVDERR
ncbi:transcriptional regulator [Paenibacillus hemerocallicola]|uniref:Transcriptional regulator n=1 Tax=Paenibacillus hemerocallicola TaxID=1172614 RepID=A0A5C4TB62_9BACL|nr:sugar diacid recognition domain-containing protein [Paenibacillus hemerocallicola]TNJ65707.1 transcriptional regulator [Paenibacillus hemerocallicola]